MKPAGYHVVPSTGSPMLILNYQDAVDKAAQRHGHVTALYSLEQIARVFDGLGYLAGGGLIRNLDSI